MKWAAAIALACFVLAVVVALPVLGQEGNPVPILVAIARLHLAGTDVVQWSAGPPARYVTRGRGGIEPFTAFMAKKGYAYEEQLGAGVVYRRGDAKLIAEQHMLTRLYRVWSLPRSP